MSQTLTALSAAVPLAAGWSIHSVWMRRRIAAARRDPLSGLPTRAAFERLAARALTRGPHVVLMIDLDGFKKLNDTFGHGAGDEAIRSTAASLNDALADRQGSVAARLGGDEFAAIVPVPDPAALPWLLRGLHNEVTSPFTYRGQTLAVGASIGASLTAEPPSPSLSWALRRADEAMYAAKRSGGGWHLVPATETPALLSTINGRRAGRPGAHLKQEGTRS